jgi:TPR repeat protein
MGLGLDRAQAQAYVDRAAAADPRDPEPHSKLVTFLLPKWHGEEGDALRYARQVADRPGADPALNVVVIMAHKQLCESFDDADERQYLTQVREEMERRYAAVLTAYPDALESWRGLSEFREKIDDARFVESRLRCIELDDGESMVRIGNCYDRGLAGLKRDPVRAARLFCRAAWLDYKGAKADLAQVLLEGKAGVPVDHARGLTLLRDALEAGDVHAKYLMGRALSEGAHGLTKDMRRGAALLNQAVEEGHIAASGLLGRWLYLAGDLEQGIGLLQRAASNDDPAAQLLMGEIAGFGRALGGPEVEPSPRHGAIYFRWAIRNEVPGARERLAELLKKHPEQRQPGDPQ